MVVINATKNIIISRRASMANTFFSRMSGLLGRPPLQEDEALVITRCRSIHMFFMRYAIDVIFVGRENRVVGLVENIGPFRLSPVFWKAEFVVELMAGTIAVTKTSVGDTLELQA